MRPSIRLAALSGIQVIYVFTHDSIGLGEDGPTHQPVEHFAALRSIPNLHVFRPADARETLEAWQAALERRDGPSLLLLSRQKLPGQPHNGSDGTARGGYVLAEPAAGLKTDAILMATGSEVQVVMSARDLLAKDKIGARVVSLPCWELFDQQPDAYRKSVLSPAVTNRVAVEAGVSLGWDRYTGGQGVFIGMKGFGYSAPFQKIYEHVGITPRAVADAVKTRMS
jgi:transketolase